VAKVIKCGHAVAHGTVRVAHVSALFILGYLIYNGGKDLSWNFFTRLPAPVGEAGGGMANAIVGSLKLLLLAALFGVPIGLLGGVYLAEFGGRTGPVPGPLHGGLAERRAIDRDRYFCVLPGCDADASLFDSRRRFRVGIMVIRQ